MTNDILVRINKVISAAQKKINQIELETREKIESILHPKSRMTFGKGDIKKLVQRSEKQLTAGQKAAATRKAQAKGKEQTPKRKRGRPRKNK